MFNTIPKQFNQTINFNPAEDIVIHALAQRIQQQYPKHIVKIEYSGDESYFLKIFKPRAHHQATVYCYVTYETATLTVLHQNFKAETHIDLADPESLTQFDQILNQHLVAP